MNDNNNRSVKSKLAPLLVSAVCLCIGAYPADAISKSDENKISRIEKKLFFKTYETDAIEKRLARLEKFFFGDASNASMNERVAKVFEAAGPQVDADGTASPGQLAPPQAATQAPAENARAQSGPEQSQAKRKKGSPSPQTQAPPGKDLETDKAWERANLSAQAARDAEIKNLLKEGIRLWKRKDADQAIEKFNQVIRFDPENAEAHFSLGVIYEAKGQLAEAEAAYRKAHDSNPDRMDYKEAITTLQEKHTKQQKTNAKQEEINKQAQDAADAFKRKEYMTAINLYKQLENDYPKNAAYKYNIGTIYLIMGSQVQALEYYEKARKLSPKEERYMTACEKLKATVQQDAESRKESDKEWDAKEKQDKKAAKQREREQKERQKRNASGRPSPPPQQQRVEAPRRGGKIKSGDSLMGTGDMQRILDGFGGGGAGTRRSSPPAPKQSLPPGFDQPNMSQPSKPNTDQQMSYPQHSPPQGFNQPMQSGPSRQMQTGFNQQSGFPTQGQSSYGQNGLQQGFSQPGVNQGSQGFNQGAQAFNPGTQTLNSGSQGFGAQGFNQGGHGFNQGSQGANGSQGFTPAPQGFNQGMQGFNPGAQVFNPGAQGFNQGMQGFNPGAQAFNPGAQGFNPGAQGDVSPLIQPGSNNAQKSAPHSTPNKTAHPPAKQLTGTDLLASLGLIVQPSAKGVMVTTIGIGSRAAKAGVASGDVILAVDGVSVTSLSHLATLLSHKQTGESAKLLINRKGQIGQVTL